MDTANEEPKTSPLVMSGIKRKPIVAALIIGAFIAVLNETMLQIAFPDLMRDFSVPITTVQWLSTVYMLVVGILVPITALLQQWFTTRQMFLSATIFFLIGTIVCSIAPSFSILLAGRVVQALGTGLMLPVLMNTMMLIFPPERRGSAMGIIGLVVMFAPAIGPTLSGLIIDTLSWRWLFYLVIPIAVFSMLFTATYLINVSDVTKPKVDYLSISIILHRFRRICVRVQHNNCELLLGNSSAGVAYCRGYRSSLIHLAAAIHFITDTGVTYVSISDVQCCYGSHSSPNDGNVRCWVVTLTVHVDCAGDDCIYSWIEWVIAGHRLRCHVPYFRQVI